MLWALEVNWQAASFRLLFYVVMLFTFSTLTGGNSPSYQILNVHFY